MIGAFWVHKPMAREREISSFKEVPVFEHCLIFKAFISYWHCYMILPCSLVIRHEHIFSCISVYSSTLSESPVTKAWRILRLWMEEMVSRHGGQLKIY
jgi:hypothetical protein